MNKWVLVKFHDYLQIMENRTNVLIPWQELSEMTWSTLVSFKCSNAIEISFRVQNSNIRSFDVNTPFLGTCIIGMMEDPLIIVNRIYAHSRRHHKRSETRTHVRINKSVRWSCEAWRQDFTSAASTVYWF